MSGERAPLFGKPNLDVSKFAPKGRAPAKEVREIAEKAGFASREPQPPTSSEPQLSAEELREQRRYRTGRNVAFSLKVRQADLDRFYRLAKQEGVVMGEAFARALDAWEEKLTQE